MPNYIVETERKIPVTAECGVLVAGGGIAGISAALAAARTGAKVILVEKGCFLGGLATAGLVTIYLPLCDGMGHQVSFGIAEELLRLSIKYGAEDRNCPAWLEDGTLEEKKQKRFEVQFNPHLFALCAEELLRQENVTILYDTVLCGAHVANSRITAVTIENKSGRQMISCQSAVDATGDADLCAMSGEATVVFQTKNVLANWYYFLSRGKLNLKMLGFAEVPGNIKQEFLIERRFGGLDGFERSEMLQLGHRHMLEDILRHKESDPSYVPVTMPNTPQLRMTRRIDGCYTLDDTQNGEHFTDSIGIISDWRKPGPVYEIPFRCLYGKKIKNLITAGRCISVTDAMWDISRVIPACAVTGQAAGTAAAMSNDFSVLDISALRKNLTGVQTDISTVLS